MKKTVLFCTAFLLVLSFPFWVRTDGTEKTAEEAALPVLAEPISEAVSTIERETEEGTDAFPKAYCVPYHALICQHPDFPTGCESAAAVSLLRHWGVNISLAEFADDYLEKDGEFRLERGLLYGPDPYRAFVGSPRDDSSFGCMAPPICEAMQRVAGNLLSVTELRGMEPDALCRRFVAEGKPVLVWVSMNMSEIKKGVEWILPDGRQYTWPSGEHCMVLVGYDEAHYILMDPEKGELRSFPKEDVEQAYRSLGMQAIAAIPVL